MGNYGDIVMRAPLKVYAKMWTPYSKIPHVREVSASVIEAPDMSNSEGWSNKIDENMFVGGGFPMGGSLPTNEEEWTKQMEQQLRLAQTGGKLPFSVVTHGIVKIFGSDEEIKVKPRDYILYHPGESKEPVGVITEDEYNSQYSGAVVDFCDTCKRKLSGQPEPEPMMAAEPKELDFSIPPQVKEIFEKGETLRFTGSDGNIIVLNSLDEYIKYVKDKTHGK